MFRSFSLDATDAAQKNQALPCEGLAETNKVAFFSAGTGILDNFIVNSWIL